MITSHPVRRDFGRWLDGIWWGKDTDMSYGDYARCEYQSFSIFLCTVQPTRHATLCSISLPQRAGKTGGGFSAGREEKRGISMNKDV